MTESNEPDKNYPKTFPEAVQRVLSDLPESDKEKIRNMGYDEFVYGYDFGLGMSIRNVFGLWGDNKRLLNSCFNMHPDTVSGWIMDGFWEALHPGEKAGPEWVDRFCKKYGRDPSLCLELIRDGLKDIKRSAKDGQG